MIKLFFAILVFAASVNISYAQLFIDKPGNSDTLKPEIDIIPSVLTVPAPEGQFIMEDFKVLNRGGGVLKITKIDATCSCANGKVLSSNVVPLSVGKIQMTINMDGLDKHHRIVDFTIHSNASNSPFMVRIVVENPPAERKIDCKIPEDEED